MKVKTNVRAGAQTRNRGATDSVDSSASSSSTTTPVPVVYPPVVYYPVTRCTGL